MRDILLILFIFAISVTATFSQTAASQPLRAVNGIDLQRYKGEWFEIAKYPNRFQKQCVANTTATYTLKENGRIEVLNECLKKDGTTASAKGEAKVGDNSNNAKLKVRFAPGFIGFLPFVWANYWVVELAPDYSYAVIGEPKRNYFWILSRTPTMPDGRYREILKRAEAMGFDPTQVEKTPQNASVRDRTVVFDGV